MNAAHQAPGWRIGTAGWSLPRECGPRFPEPNSHLERYARVLAAVEINSSFYKPHQPQTYARWAASTPPGFLFSVKLPKAITHGQRLVGTVPLVDAFLAEATALGDRLGCLLVQLPPTLAFDEPVVAAFLGDLRARHAGNVALEPRHASWFAPAADALMASRRVARVLADPVLHAGGERPGGWPGLVYCRLHGSPRMYYSAYDDKTLAPLAARIARAVQVDGAQIWCIFDNTAHGAATSNALDLQSRLGA